MKEIWKKYKNTNLVELIPATSLGFKIVLISYITLMLLFNFWDYVSLHHELIRNLGLVCAALVGFPMLIWRTRIADRQAATGEASHTAETYTKAIEQLGAKSADGMPSMELRLGGLYALENIARTNEKYHPQIIEVLCAYVRMHAPKPAETPSANESQEMVESGCLVLNNDERSPLLDVQTALTIIGRRCVNFDGDVSLNLAHTELSGYQLYKANFAKADLTGAKLTGAKLSGANLACANLSSANLSGASLIEAYLPEAFLSNSDLTDACLSDATLLNANLSNADLNGADLWGADLNGANLSRAKLIESRLIKANLTNVLLIRADLTGVDLSEAKLTIAKLTRAILSKANLSKADLSGADLTSAILTEANLTEANLTRTDFTEANLTRADFTEANLTEANFTRADIGSTRVYKAVIEGAYPPEKKNKLLNIMLQQEEVIGQREGAD